MRAAVIALTLGLLSYATVAEAQSVTMSMDTDRTEAAVGEPFTLQLKIDVSGVNVDSVDLPNFDNFQVVGRSVSRPMQFSFSFGGQTQHFEASTVYTFTLIPTKPGTFTIGAAKAAVGNRVVQSNTVTMTVGGSAAASANGIGGMTISGHATSNFDNTAFIRTVVSKTDPYVGEQVTVTMYLYTKDPLQRSPETTKEASTAGFWVQDLFGPNHSIEARADVVKGRPYYVYEMKRLAAFPLSTGDQTVGPMELRAVTGRDSLFDPDQRQIVAKGQPVVLHVRGLPPEAKNGVVGQYTLETSVDRPSTHTGDAVTITAQVKGAGNVRDVELALPPQKGLRIFDPQTDHEISLQGTTVMGTRTWKWLVVPDAPGSYTVPPLTITEFDPATAKVETVQSAPLTFEAEGKAIAHMPEADKTVADGNGDGASPNWGALRGTTQLRRHSVPVMKRAWFPWVVAAPPTLWLLSLMLGMGRRHFTRVAGERENVLAKRASDHLAKARALSRTGQAKDFYAEVTAALRAGLEARLGEPTGGFTHPELRAHLLGRGMPEDLTQRVVDELEGFDFARFAASASDLSEMAHCTDRVAALLTRIGRYAPTGAPRDNRESQS